MEKLTVHKQNLIDVLVENRDKHQKEYELALEGYKMSAIEQLKAKLKEFNKSETFDPNWKNLHESHVKEYDDTIDMLKVVNDDYILISMGEYLRFYKNEWQWANNWNFMNTGYVGIGSTSPKFNLE